MDPGNPPPSTGADTKAIAEIVREACPLESDLMGETAVEQIAAGHQFQALPGGSHINLLDVITLLSGAVTIAQFAMQLWGMRAATESTSDFDQRLRALVMERSAQNPELMSALKRDDQLLDRVIMASKALLSRSR